MVLRGLVVYVNFVVDRCHQSSNSGDDDGGNVEDVHGVLGLSRVVGYSVLYSSWSMCSENACWNDLLPLLGWSYQVRTGRTRSEV